MAHKNMDNNRENRSFEIFYLTVFVLGFEVKYDPWGIIHIPTT